MRQRHATMGLAVLFRTEPRSKPLEVSCQIHQGTHPNEDPAAVLFLAGVAEIFQAQDVRLLVPAHPGGVFDEGGVRRG